MGLDANIGLKYWFSFIISQELAKISCRILDILNSMPFVLE